MKKAIPYWSKAIIIYIVLTLKMVNTPFSKISLFNFFRYKLRGKTINLTTLNLIFNLYFLYKIYLEYPYIYTYTITTYVSVFENTINEGEHKTSLITAIGMPWYVIPNDITLI